MDWLKNTLPVRKHMAAHVFWKQRFGCHAFLVFSHL